ncbi:MAG: acetolactate synthase small subunit [Lachnospiraceae bacterium]|nr:acetolactate synthase small subunit [Lachnospiraceae bacterium]
MNKRVFQILADNTTGVLSRVSGLFSRRGYNIESITAGITADSRYSRITIVASGDDEALEQIEKQVAKLVDVRSVKELDAEGSVYRELALVKVKADANVRGDVKSIVDFYKAKIIDVGYDSLIIELTGNSAKIDSFLDLLRDYEILELARTGIAGLCRGSEGVVYL